MAYDEFLADRISNIFNNKHISFEAKKMMGGLCFMVNNKMCCGIVKNKLMARIGPDVYDEALKKEGCSEMDFSGKPIKGMVYIDPFAMDMDEDLEYWIDVSLKFNPFAKASKKKSKKA